LLRMTTVKAPPSQLGMGQILELQKDWTGAVDAYWRSINLDENKVESYERLAALYSRLRYLGRSCWYAAQAAKLRGFDAGSLDVLARAQYQAGKVSASLRTFRAAMSRSPADAALHSRYLFTLLHSAVQSPASLRRAHENWFKMHGPPSPGVPDFKNLPDPSRKLRLGYVSSDFYQSPDWHFFWPVLRNHDRQRFTIYCYHSANIIDPVTKEFKKIVDRWRDVGGLQPAKIRAQIQRDRIDVLVERSVHFAPWQAGTVFHSRAAPIQVAYLSYPCTTGCRQIDYFVTDHWLSPRLSPRLSPNDRFARQYSEPSLYNLPSGSILYEPDPRAPEVDELPASRNGYITFGIFQRPAKFNNAFWDTTATILQRVRNARLLVQHADNELDEPDGEGRKRVLSALKKHGVASHRIDFSGTKDFLDHLRMLTTVDIALDTYPYSGTTTTCACAWMGVPVVTLAGDTHVSRVSYSILSRIGLADWASTSSKEYVEIAVSKAANFRSLARVRSSLRQRMRESSVCRPDVVVRELEQGYRFMWNQWCSSRTLSS
jgi:protein O-GlcNAc transferase